MFGRSGRKKTKRTVLHQRRKGRVLRSDSFFLILKFILCIVFQYDRVIFIRISFLCEKKKIKEIKNMLHHVLKCDIL
jgi:hypothetical protein